MVWKAEPKRVAVFGLGYVGLTVAISLAMHHHTVIGVDINEGVIKQLRDGKVHLSENGLETTMNSLPSLGRVPMEFTTDAEYAIKNSDCAFICVNTPPTAEGSLDVSAVRSVFEEIQEHSSPFYTVFVKSTMPVGETRKLHNIKSVLKSNELFYVPEFLSQGSAWNNYQTPSRIVIGSSDGKRSFSRAEWQWHMLTNENDYMHSGTGMSTEVINCTYESGEMAKLANNAMLATKVSFVNEIALLCEKTGADIEQVTRVLTHDERLGYGHWSPSPGWGGHCLPKDLHALVTLQRSNNLTSNVLAGTYKSNSSLPSALIQRVKKVYPRLNGHYGLMTKRYNFAVWGLGFKAGTSDVTSSAALKVIINLTSMGADVKLYDPLAKMPYVHGNVTECDTAADTLHEADGLFVLTRYADFAAFGPTIASLTMNQRIMFDLCNIMPVNDWDDVGFKCYTIGKPDPVDS